MGLIAKLLSFVRRAEAGELLDEAKVDTGGSSKTAQCYAPPGDDSQPLPGDYPCLVEVDGAGQMAVVAWHDTKTERKAGPGERRLYARSGPGVAACEVWLKADGTLLFVADKVIVDSPDVRVGDENASQQVARVGDLISGSLNALAPQGSPGVPVPLMPVPGISGATASGGITFVGQIISGATRTKAS